MSATTPDELIAELRTEIERRDEELEDLEFEREHYDKQLKDEHAKSLAQVTAAVNEVRDEVRRICNVPTMTAQQALEWLRMQPSTGRSCL